MLNLKTVLLLVLLILPIASVYGADAEFELRVMTFNIHAGKGLDGKTDLDRVASIIKNASPDLVALQEVDVKTRRSGKVDQANRLAKLCGMKSCFAKAIDYQGGEYGNAILSSMKFVATNEIEVSKHGGERRVAVGAAVRLENQEIMTLISTHFDHKNAKARENASRVLANIVRKSNGPVIVAGDLNADLNSKELNTLNRVVKNSSEQPVFTFPAKTPTQQIDFVLLDKKTKWKVKSIEAIDTTNGASDHRPLLVVFEVDNN